MTETETTKTPLEIGVDRYVAGENPDTLIPYFKEVCDRYPKDYSAFTCLAWLYLLDNQGEKALKVAQRGYKIQPRDPQTLINLSLAMLETKAKGVRQHIDSVQEILFKFPELKPEIKETLEEGLTRKPDWKNLAKLKEWLFAV
jgi:tetratricopeptide (TPR) repeat protein